MEGAWFKEIELIKGFLNAMSGSSEFSLEIRGAILEAYIKILKLEILLRGGNL